MISETDPTVGLDFGYTGKYYDDLTGLQNNLHRWYDPKLGKWISEDPIGFNAGDANLYRYVGNGPTDARDPSGLWEWSDNWFTQTVYVVGSGVYAAGGAAQDMKEGATDAASEVLFYARDVGAVDWDAASTWAGYPIGVTEWSHAGESLQPNDPNYSSKLIQRSARIGLAGLTAGGSEIAIGVEEFSECGDAKALSRHMGGVAAGNLAGSLGGRFSRNAGTPAPKNVANVVDGTASNGGNFRGGAFIDGKVYVGRGGHFDGAVSAGARSVDRATAKGISVFEKDGIVYWANDSISLPKALTQSEMATVREALQAAFPGKDIRQLVSISDALK